MNWWDYVKEVAGEGTSTHKIAAKMDDRTSPATVNRWKTGTQPDIGKVVSFCRAYGENPVVGFVRAGHITEEEARTAPYSLASTEELIAMLEAEIERRTKRRR